MKTSPAFRSSAHPLPLPLGKGWGERVGMSPRRAFTLIELLVVVGIIAMLAAIVTPAVMNARKAARNASIKTEIDMLHMALMNYKNEYGSFPPCSAVPNVAGTDLASRHLQRIFPRMTGTNAQYQATQAQLLSYINTTTGTFASLTIGIDNAIVLWLHGYTSDPTRPVFSTTGTVTLAASSGTVTWTGSQAVRRKLFDFDMSRVTSGTDTPLCRYYPSGAKNSFYVYIDSSQYLVSGAVPVTSGFYPHRIPANAVSGFMDPSRPAFNPDTFQILSAGVNGTFGDDDDLSNFWPGTRKQYLDSLQSQ